MPNGKALIVDKVPDAELLGLCHGLCGRPLIAFRAGGRLDIAGVRGGRDRLNLIRELVYRLGERVVHRLGCGSDRQLCQGRFSHCAP